MVEYGVNVSKSTLMIVEVSNVYAIWLHLNWNYTMRSYTNVISVTCKLYSFRHESAKGKAVLYKLLKRKNMHTDME